jgi:hypothetical protein
MRYPKLVGLFIPASNVENKTTMNNPGIGHLFVHQPDLIGKSKDFVLGGLGAWTQWKSWKRGAKIRL